MRRQTLMGSVEYLEERIALAGDNPMADVSIIKGGGPQRVSVGQDVVYGIEVTNNGPSMATGVVVTDVLPTGAAFVTAHATQGSALNNGGTLTASLGDLPNGTTATVTIIMRATTVGVLSNVASVVADQSDPNLGNDTTPPFITPVDPESTGPISDLVITKLGRPDAVFVGGNLVYQVAVTNNGPSFATGVIMTDLLPVGAPVVSTFTTQGTVRQEAGLLIATLGDLGIGATATVTIIVRPTVPGTLSNVAEVEGDQPDSNPDNNVTQPVFTSVIPTPMKPSADLAITKSGSQATLFVGDDLTYHIIVTNNGPNSATGVVMGDLLPVGVTFVSATTTQGTVSVSGGILTATLGNLKIGAMATVSIIVRPTASGTISNVAEVAGQQPDPNPNNNTTPPVFTSVEPIPVQVPPATVVRLQRFGFHMHPTRLVITFSAPLDAQTAQDVQNYHIVGSNHKTFRVAQASYDSNSQTVTLRFAKHFLYLFRKYQLTVVGSRPGGVTDVFGRLIDGAGTGQPGSDYVQVFGPRILAGA